MNKRRFVSRRNEVYLEDGAVVKRHADAARAALEAEFLAALREKGVAVPRVLDRSGPALRMEYIGGLTLPDFLERLPDDAACDAAAGALARWLQRFYDAVDFPRTGEIRGDVNGRNFLLGDGVAGVDFEAHVFGARETDAGRLLAFIDTYTVADPAPQRRLARSLLAALTDTLALDVRAVEAARRAELAAMAARRK